MADEKISQMQTLANPPLAPVFDAVITNDGTTVTNYQRPQGLLVQPEATGSEDGAGIKLQTGAPGPSGVAAGVLEIYTAGFSSTADTLVGGIIQLYTYPPTLSNPAAVGYGGIIEMFAGGVRNTLTANARYAKAELGSGYVLGGATALGASVIFRAGSADLASYIRTGDIGFYTPNISGGQTAVTGNIVFGLGTASGGSATNINGGLVVNGLGTVDPMVTNEAFLGVGNGITLSPGP